MRSIQQCDSALCFRYMAQFLSHMQFKLGSPRGLLITSNCFCMHCAKSPNHERKTLMDHCVYFEFHTWIMKNLHCFIIQASCDAILVFSPPDFKKKRMYRDMRDPRQRIALVFSYRLP